MRLCDLHTHSTFSDGSFTPTQLVEAALREKLCAIALTDHNTISGLPEFLNAAKERYLEAIPGVEISTVYQKKDIHILGFYPDEEKHQELEDFLGVINRRKEESNRSLIAALNAAGYEISYQEIREHHPGNVNRAVIAAELQKKGYIREIKEAFRGILSAKNGLYVPPERIGAFEAIRFLRSIKAIPVLAHPFLNLTEKELPAFLTEAKEFGLLAMETHYSTFTPEMTASAHSIAQSFGLLESGGSDFHGLNKPNIRLSIGTGDLAVPYEFVQKLKNRRI